MSAVANFPLCRNGDFAARGTFSVDIFDGVFFLTAEVNFAIIAHGDVLSLLLRDSSFNIE